MTRKSLSLVASVGLVAFLYGAPPAWAQTIGNAQSFAIVGGQAVNVNGAGSVVNGDVGIDPAAGNFITGFPGYPPNIGGGTVTPPFSVRGNDASAILAEAAANNLYNSAAMAPAGAVVLGGLNLSLSNSVGSVAGHYVPGHYTDPGGVVLLTTSITLDGAGTYIFSFTSALTTSVGSTIILNGADPCSVWWRVPTQATLNGTSFVGTVVSNALIALGSNATVLGRALTTANGSVTLAGSDNIGGCSGAPVSPVPTPPVPIPAVPFTDLFIVKHHTDTFTVGTNATYSIALFNAGSLASTGGTKIVDTLPAGLTFVSATGTGWSCSAAGQVVTCITLSSVPAAGPFANNITVTVMPSAAAVPTVTNRAVVSEGGDSILDNNTTIDITLVAQPVPTLSEWAFILLAVLLAAAGVVALRRRTAA